MPKREFLSSLLRGEREIVISTEICGMAKPSFELVAALRESAGRLRKGAHYAWGNHGACNCGHLAQVITNFSEGEILRFAQTRIGEWTELATEYCGITNTPVGLVMSKLEEAGLTPLDIRHLEYLTDRNVLHRLPGGFRWLRRNYRDDVILYFETFATLLEDMLASSLNISMEDLTVKELVCS